MKLHSGRFALTRRRRGRQALSKTLIERTFHESDLLVLHDLRSPGREEREQWIEDSLEFPVALERAAAISLVETRALLW